MRLLAFFGLPTALALAWRSDSAGPPESVEEVLQTWRDLRATFHAAVTVSSATFEEFEAELEKVRASLPLFANVELGNTWAHGDAADPYRVAAARALEHVRLSTCA